jgi:formyltetrahydrofolate deformylase
MLLSCPDRRGIVAAVANFVLRHGGNIVHSEQYTDEEASVFFQRVEFEFDGLRFDGGALRGAFAPVAREFSMDVRITAGDARPRVAVLLSRERHCTYDLLSRWRGGELPADVVAVVSNHPDHADVAEHFDIPYHHFPIATETKADQEAAVRELLAKQQVDLVVLARYMQILSPGFIDEYRHRIINIHHSFLPAFSGGRPYHQAHDRGVKLVGVTAHYASEDLDQGPIIDQDVIRVDHRDGVADLIRKGRDLEKIVLARAVLAHVENRTLIYGNKTVVFR